MPIVVVKPLVDCPVNDRARLRPTRISADADRARAFRQGGEQFCDPPQDEEGAPGDRFKIEG